MIGERFDADAGLQYLNARYYDPKLAMFIQPDWWEVMQPGVGVNRYGYSFNDPVNGMDPTGHDSFGSGNPYSGYDTDGDGYSKHVGGWTYDSSTDVGARDPDSDHEGRGGPTGSQGYGLAMQGTVYYGSYSQIESRYAAIAFNSNTDVSGLAAISGLLGGGFSVDDAINMAVTGSLSFDPTANLTSGIWSRTKKFTAAGNAARHWKDHGNEFPEYQNSTEYINGTWDFVTNPPSGTHSVVRRNGETMYYNMATNTFAVVSSDGVPKTMFKPSDGILYWESEVAKR